jgi:anti-sigma regulatory factor (Ser/Thr protein kinase)
LASREVLTLAPSRRAPACARRAVRAFAIGSVSAETADTAELLASELVTNAVVHGRGAVTVLMEYDADGLGVTVCDDEPALPVLPDPDPLSLGGRGLHLVAALSDAWGVDPSTGGPGKSVWFRLG